MHDFISANLIPIKQQETLPEVKVEMKEKPVIKEEEKAKSFA